MQEYTINTHRTLGTITGEQREALTLLSDTFSPFTDKRIFSYKQAVDTLENQHYDTRVAKHRILDLIKLGYLTVVET